MGRTLIAVLGAAVVGSTGGGLAALHFTSPRPRAPKRATPTPPVPAVSDAVVPDAGLSDARVSDLASVPPPTSPQAILTTQMTAVLTRFAAWSRDHARAPCPDLATLGLAARDPWGHDLELTCTDQPADQTIGALSAGPDRVLGTDDDVPSWTLGPSVTSLVRGPRWKSAPAALSTRPPKPPRSTKPPPRRQGPLVADPPPSTAPIATPPLPVVNHTSPPATPAAPPATVPPPPDPTGDDIPARRSSR